MEHIVKTINLEEFKTRFPLTYPSLKYGNVFYLDKDTISDYPNGNYNLIPCGLNEKICGPYENFTKEMGELYKGQTLYYSTLKKWYDEFLEYYDLLYSNECNKPYSSATQYYTIVEGDGGINYQTYKDMDDSFQSHGGENFYKWLLKYYFVSLDLKNEYFFAKNENIKLSLSYPEWISVIDNMESPIMYYPDVIELYGEIALWYKTFGKEKNNSKYVSNSNYKEYINKGGYDTYLILKNWISKTNTNFETINNNVEYYEDELSPSMTLQIPLKKKVEDFGNLSIFCPDFVAGEKYNVGNICLYSGETYILTASTSYGYKIADSSYVFDDEAWQTYYNYYKKSHPDDFSEYLPDYILSGRTVSSLDNFTRTTETVDNLGNSLPGYYEVSSASTYVQPPEDQILELKYELGKAVNYGIIDEEGKIYSGDLLYYLELYLCDTEGNKLQETSYIVKEGESVADTIDLMVRKSSSLENVDDTIHCDFTYYIGTTFTYENKKAKLVNSNVNGKDYELGVKCVEHCTLSILLCIYFLSENEKYTVRYLKVNKDIEEKYNESAGKYVNVAMTDWFIEPKAYKANDMIVAPSIRKEEVLGFSLPETIENNIYIDRGYSTVLDKHLRIGEVTSFDTLSKYGNGLFNLISLEEESI